MQMKKWIKEAVRKSGCFILIAAMLAGSFPLQTVATTVANDNQPIADGNEGEESTPEENVDAILGTERESDAVSESAVNAVTENEITTGSKTIDKAVTTSGSDAVIDTVDKTEDSNGTPFHAGEGDENVLFTKVNVENELSKSYYYDEATGKRGYKVSVSGDVVYQISDTILDEETKNQELNRYTLRLSLFKNAEDGLVEEVAWDECTLSDGTVLVTPEYVVENEDVQLSWGMKIFRDGEIDPVDQSELKTEPVSAPKAVTVKITDVSSIELADGDLEYKGSQDGTNRYFQAAINAGAAAEFGDGTEVAGSDRALEKQTELSRYKLRVFIKNSSNSEVYKQDLSFNLAGEKNESISIDTSSLPNCEFHENDSYTWYTVVVKDDVELEETRKTGNREIMIPEPIQVEVGNLELRYECQPQMDGAECTSYKVPLTVSAGVNVTGATGLPAVPIEKRMEEIKYCLDQKKLSLQEKSKDVEAWDSIAEINLKDYEYAFKKAEGEEVYNARFSFTEEQIKNVTGEWSYSAVLTAPDGSKLLESNKVDNEIEPIEQSFEFAASDGKIQHSLGEKFSFQMQEGAKIVGPISCYESDKDGNPVEGDSHLEIEYREDEQTCYVTGKEIGSYYIGFLCSGNDIYAPKSKIYEVNIGKEILTGSVSVCDVQKGLPFIKYNTLQITTNIKSIQPELFRDYYRDIEIVFSAVPEVGSGKTVILGSMSGKDASFSDETGNASYVYTVKKNRSDQLKENCIYTIQAELKYKNQAELQYEGKILEYEGFCAQNIAPYIDLKDFEMEYGESRKLEFSVYDILKAGKNDPIDESVLSYEYKSSDPTVIGIDSDGTVHALKGGSAEITVSVDDADNNLVDRYLKTSVTITITAKAPQSIDYTINGDKNIPLNDFKAQAVKMTNEEGGTEYWYEDKITICPAEGSAYTEIVYRKDGGIWSGAKEKLEIDVSMPADYEFYFCNSEKNIYSYDAANEKETVSGGLMRLEQIGVGFQVDIKDSDLKTGDGTEKEYFYKESFWKEQNGYYVNVSGTVDQSIKGAGSVDEAILNKMLSRYTMELTVTVKDKDGTDRSPKPVRQSLLESFHISLPEEMRIKVTEETEFQWQLAVYKDDDTKPVAICKGGPETVTKPVPIELDAEIAGVTQGSIEYISVPSEGRGYFQSSIGAEANAKFTKGKIPEDNRQREKEKELSRYELQLYIEKPNGEREYKTSADFKLTGDNYNEISIDSANLSDAAFHMSGNYRWCAVIMKDAKELEGKNTKREDVIPISIPEKIGVELNYPDNMDAPDHHKNKLILTQGEAIRQYESEDKDKVTSYKVPVTVSADISLTGIEDEKVSAAQRSEEIKYCLEQQSMEFQIKGLGKGNWETFASTSLYQEEVAKNLIENVKHSADFTYTVSPDECSRLDAAGDYPHRAMLNPNKSGEEEGEEFVVTIDPIEQDFNYTTSNTAEDKKYIIGESYEFTLNAERNLYGTPSFYESYEDGTPREYKNQEEIPFRLEAIGKTEDNRDSGKKYRLTSNRNAIDKHFVSFTWSGDKIYAPETRTYEIDVKKTRLNGELGVYSVEKKVSLFGIEFYKADSIQITTTLSAEQKTLLESCYKNIAVSFRAIPDGHPDKAVELGAANAKSFQYSNEDGKAVCSYFVPVKNANQLKEGYEYSIQAVLSYEDAEKFPYEDLTILSDKFDVKNIMPYIDIKSQQVEYGTTKQLEFTVYDTNGDKTPAQTPLSYEFESKEKEMLEIDENGVLYPISNKKTAGVTVWVDDVDNKVEDRYNRTSVSVDITVTPPKNTDYTINGVSEKEFYSQAGVVLGDKNHPEYWYEDSITIAPADGNLYTEIAYRKKGSQEWKYAKDRFVVPESEITDYEFFFCMRDLNLYSYDAEKEINLVAHALKTLERVGVDKTEPDIATLLSADRKSGSHSTGSAHYFAEDVNFSIYSNGNVNSKTAIDSGCGIREILVQYGDGKWQTMSDLSQAERYINSFTFLLSENKAYGTIRIKAVDYLGRESKAAEYKGAYGTDKINTSAMSTSPVSVCIDKTHPVIAAVPYYVDAQGRMNAYDGSWTNQQLKYVMNLVSQQSSGIYSYQYTLVPRGTGFDTAKAKWKNVASEDLSVVFGAPMPEKAQNTYSGEFSYPDTNTGDAGGVKPAAYEQQNGVLYFRAESNAGLFTEEHDIVNSAKEMRIWQEDIKNARVSADNRSDSTTGWYNSKTGPVGISFEYPAYKEKEYAPAVGVVYEFHKKTLTDDTVMTRTFYKGILNEAAGTVTEVEDYTKPWSNTSLSGNGAIRIDTDSVNQLVVYTEDIAGNKSDKAVYNIKADYVAPTQMKMLIDGEEQIPHSSLSDRIVYRSFSQNEVTVKGEVDYGISGKQTMLMQKCKNLGEWSDLSNAITGEMVTLAPCTRGFVYMYAVDGAGNTSEAWSDGIATDNLAPVGPDNSDIRIQAFGANSKGFFNGDFKVAVSVSDAPSGDDYSGLKSIMYSVGRGDSETKSNVSLYQFDTEEPTWEDIVRSLGFMKDDVMVSASENESNEAFFKVTAVDNAGNTKTVSQVFMIDVTKPQIDVSFDKTNETKFYNTDRVATVQITELNFDPNLVKFNILKDGVQVDTLVPSGDSWSASSGNVHTANIIFHEDGDYTFTVECTDMADNSSEFQKVEEFTVDQTKPVVEVSYDNNTARNQNYYNASRSATITVEEHNFDEKAFEASVTPQVSLGGWSHSGDTHRTSLNFNADEHYLYTLKCTDLAGNEMEPFEEEEFYVDTEAPEIAITGVADQSANAGDVIPVVIASDTNYDEAGMKITLQNSKGNVISLNQERSVSEGGHVYRLANVNEQPDEIYTLTVAGTDMAGNESEMSYRFSLNRHGSTYDLSEMSRLVDKVYTRYADLDDLHILETNVDEIEDFTVYISRNGEMLNDSQVNAWPGSSDANMIYYKTEVSGDSSLGYQYNYTVYKENFEQEGIYNIMFYSKDRAGNEVNNTLSEKGAEITFVVDNTAPTVVIEGVNAGEFYAEDSKEVNVYASDNFKLKEANFHLVDEAGTTVQTYNYMELAEDEGEIVTLTIPNNDKKLSLLYSVADAAGNTIVTLQNSPDVPTGFMVTTNAWLRYINNNAAVVGTVCAAGTASAAGALIFRRRKLGKRKAR